MHQKIPFQTYIDWLGSQVIAAEIAGNPMIRQGAVDSREIGQGDLFVAIPGERLNGLDYVSEAVEAGAKAVVAEEKPSLPPDVGFAKVKDAYTAAGRIAEISSGFPASRMNVIGITGTNGKTTVVLLLHHILEHASREAGCISTIRYCLGDGEFEDAARTTPMPFAFQYLLLRMAAKSVTDVVLEVSSHALQQRRCGYAPFTAGAFTNLTQDHLDYHGSMEAYFAAKKRLFTEGIKTGGIAVINIDDPYGDQLIAESKELRSDLCWRSVGRDDRADMVMRHASSDENGGIVEIFEWERGESIRLQTPMPGWHNLYNVVIAFTLAREIGVPHERIKEGVHAYKGVPGRLERIQGGNGVTVFVDYAHTPDALENVLSTLSNLNPHALAVVCGCGGDRDHKKRPEMARIAQIFTDRVYLTSDNPRGESVEGIIEDMMGGIGGDDSEVYRIPDRRQAIRQAVADASPGHIILVAGKGHETFQEIGDQKYPFDDRVEVQKAIAEQQ